MTTSEFTSRYKEFFKLLVEGEPYDWQVEVAEKIRGLESTGGVLLLRAETGSGKTEASTLPGLFLGRQVLVVEPYRALIEDMVCRFQKYLLKLSLFLGEPYSLGIDYGGRHRIYEFISGRCKEVETKKPFGTDVLITTIDEMVYRILSVGAPRKASVYSSLIRAGRPIIFFDEAHAYSTEASNPLVTLVHLVASLSMHSTVVLASATLPSSLERHIESIARRNGVRIEKVNAPPLPKRVPDKASVELDLGEPRSLDEAAGRLVKHVEKYVSEGVKRILVRVVLPEVAYEVYRGLASTVPERNYYLGVLHGRMPIYDRERVFTSVKSDVKAGEKVVLVATSTIEAGVDLDFDAGVMELTPYRSLEQAMGRVNRKYDRTAWATIVDTSKDTWKILEEEDYLREVRETLNRLRVDDLTWRKLSHHLKSLDEKYTEQKLSPPNLVDAYDSPYSKILAVSLYSLFHLEGSFLEHLLALSKAEYETRGSLDIVVEVEGEPGNLVRVPVSIALKMQEKHGISLRDGGALPKNLLVDHSYIRGAEKIEARGLVV